MARNPCNIKPIRHGHMAVRSCPWLNRAMTTNRAKAKHTTTRTRIMSFTYEGQDMLVEHVVAHNGHESITLREGNDGPIITRWAAGGDIMPVAYEEFRQAARLYYEEHGHTV